MGVVYKASDLRLGRSVALKFVNGQFSRWTEGEARAVATLNHPHVCTLYDVGPNYLVMELVEGVPLKGPVPVERAIEYAGQILDAPGCGAPQRNHASRLEAGQHTGHKGSSCSTSGSPRRRARGRRAVPPPSMLWPAKGRSPAHCPCIGTVAVAGRRGRRPERFLRIWLRALRATHR